MSQISIPFLEVAQAIYEAGGEDIKKCYQCGTCSGTCPWKKISNFNIRQLIRLTQFGLEGIENLIWECSTCNFCVEHCPRGVNIINIIMALRNVYASGGMLPSSLRSFVGNIVSRGNPWTGDPLKRNNWNQYNYPLFESGMEYLYFTCCTVCYDARNVRVAQATAAILNKAGLNWGLINTEAQCCGESLKKVGDFDYYKILREKNNTLFKNIKAKKIIVISPHCLEVFKNDYDTTYEVVHFVELLNNLIKNGKILPKKSYSGIKVTYHDPCYLGRHNNIYDAPRQILKSLSGLELIEMDQHHEESICCGGGGGGLWIERAKENRLSDFRLEQAIKTNSSILVTSCPYCMSMFEDSIKTGNMDDKIKVKDISELILESLE